MTVPGAALADVLDRSAHLLLDFDGPVCSSFAGLPARSAAARLRELLSDRQVAIPASVADTDDPFDLLRFADTIST